MRIKKTGAYALAGCLILSYILLLILGRGYSGDSEAYRIFYMDQKIREYISEADWKTQYCSGETEYLNNGERNENLGEGWSDAEPEARWSTGSDAYVYLYAAEGDRPFMFRMTVRGAVGYANRLVVNGMDAGELVFEEGYAEAALEAGMIRKGINTICIHTDDKVTPYRERNPESTDGRALNLYVESIELTPDEA